MIRQTLRSSALLCAAAFTSAPAFAQFDTGAFVGTVHDSTGAVISGATVTVTNPQTGISVTRETDASGSWEVPSLHTGVYRVTIAHAGFADAAANDLTLSVGARQRVDLTLAAAGTAETVEVSGVALQIETESSERGQTITGYQSAALPLVSRNYSDLLGLVAGSRQAPTAATTSSINSLVRAGAYNINGERSMFNNFLLDGLDNNAYGESNQGFDNQIIAVPPDSVAQFQVVTNNESAEYGRSSGATINVATNSGTNRFHALAYEFLRNTDLNAAGFFKPTLTGSSGISVPFKKPTFNRNQYGINLGGPILKDRLFFFLDYEGFRQVLKPLAVGTLPTQDELNGKLVVPVRNPITGKVYAPGVPIPAGDINPVSAAIVSAFRAIPTVTSGLATTGLAQDDFAAQVPFNDYSDKGDLRFDYQQNPATSWFLRVSDRKENALNAPSLGLPLDGQTNGRIRVLDQQVALGFTRLFGADKVLDARIGLSRTKAGKFSTSIGSTAFAIPGLPTNASVAGGLPTTTISGFTGFGRQSTNPQFQNPALLDPKVNFTLIKGHHSLKFGYEYEHIWMAVSDNNPLYGSFTYSGGYSLCPAGTTLAGSPACPANLTGVSSTSAVSDNFWADFLFGATSAYSAANVFTAHLRQTFNNAYAQDDWKALPNLTINAGLRWEFGSPYSEQNNYVSNFDPITQTILTTTPGASGANITPVSGSGYYNKTLINPDFNDFAPRIGFSYAADNKTAIRGGFGISFVHYTRAGSGDILAINAPQALFVAVNQNNLKPTPTNHCTGTPTVANVAGTPTVPGVAKCYVSEDQGFPAGLTTTFSPLTDNVTYVPRNTADSYVESYFLSLQRQLAKNTRLDIAYVGNHGLKLQGFVNANQLNPAVGFAQANRPFPLFSDITEALNEFQANYNSLQVKYEQQFVAGLTLLNSFTWSHALDQTSASLEGNTPSVQDANNLRADYGQSDYNLPIANVTSIVYELPVGHGRRFLSNSNGFVDSVLGGWQVSIINTMQSGTPFNVTYTPAAANQVSPTIANSFRGANLYRPNRVPGVNPILNTQIPSSGYIQYLNPAAFSFPNTAGSPFGNGSRNPLRNTPFYQTDLALNKRFSTPLESLKVEFRSEFYNILNHTNLYLPGTVGGTVPATAAAAATQDLTKNTGGQITSTFEPRIIQFGLKLIY